mmetsp:Transcript_63875/g.171111  ORF Transcript_63875/g.171111 Transcript_63875/m.171111 type:complete len:87 (+) Transcript_63875:373-633(+)
MPVHRISWQCAFFPFLAAFSTSTDTMWSLCFLHHQEPLLGESVRYNGCSFALENDSPLSTHIRKFCFYVHTQPLHPDSTFNAVTIS